MARNEVKGKRADGCAEPGCRIGAAKRWCCRHRTRSLRQRCPPEGGRYKVKFKRKEPALRRRYALRARHAVPLRSLVTNLQLRLLRLAAQERWNVQIVGRDFAARVSYVAADLLVDIGLLWRDVSGGGLLAGGLPRLRQIGGLLLRFAAGDVAESRGDHRDFHGLLHGIVHHRAENDVGIFVRGFLDDGRSFVHFLQAEAGGAGDVDQNSLRALNAIVLEQRAIDGAIRGVNRAIRTGSNRRAHHRVALAGHNCFHVGEVAIDDAGNGDDVRNALHGLAQDIVGDAEGFEEAGAVLDAIHQPLVGNDDDGVNAADQFGERLFGLLHAALAFEREGLRRNGDSERAEFAGKIRNDRSGAAAGAAAQTGGDEYHVRAIESFENFFRVLERGFAADLGIGAGAESFSELRAQLQFYGRLRKFQRLQIGVGRDEFHAFHFRADHAVDGVGTAAAHTDDLYFCSVGYFFCERHTHCRFFLRHASSPVFCQIRFLHLLLVTPLQTCFSTCPSNRWDEIRRRAGCGRRTEPIPPPWNTRAGKPLRSFRQVRAVTRRAPED